MDFYDLYPLRKTALGFSRALERSGTPRSLNLIGYARFLGGSRSTQPTLRAAFFSELRGYMRLVEKSAASWKHYRN